MLQETIVNHWASLDTVQQGIAQGTIYGIAQGIEHGILLGKEEGKVEGCLESLHPIMVLLTETRFPGIAITTKQQAASIKDPEILKLLVDSLIVARTEWDAIRLFTAAISLNDSNS